MALLENQHPSGIIPLDYYVLVELEKQEKISKGGIVIPDQNVQKQQWGKTMARIVNLGPRAFEDSVKQNLDGEMRTLRVGDYVWIVQQTVYRIMWEPSTEKDHHYYVLVTDKDILAYVCRDHVDTSKFLTDIKKNEKNVDS